MPSTKKLTPKDEMFSVVPASRRCIRLAWSICGSEALPPGTNSNRSLKLLGCRWRMAVRSMTEVLVARLDSEAVTTTSFRALLEGFK